MEKVVRYTKRNNYIIAEILIQNLDLYEAPRVLGSVEKAIIGQEFKGFVLDMRNVTSIDSSGIGFLISARNKLNKLDMPLSVANLGDVVMQIFHLTKVDKLITVYKTIDDIPGASRQ